MVSNLKAVLAVLGLVVFGAACSQNTDSSRQGIDPRPEVAAPARIEQSFAIQTSASPQALNVDKARLSLRKDALEKEFLLQTQLIQLPYAPQFQGLKSRIVAFRLRGDTVYLLEATKGHTVTNDLPQTLILAKFDVLEQTDETVTIDFNKGMSSLFVASDWRASDLEGGNYGDEFVSVQNAISYLEEAKMVNNSLLIRQIAQLKLPVLGTEMNLAVEVKYYLSPYAPDQTYVPVKSKDFLRTGYFEAAPLANPQGLDIVHATRFHPAKPITFAISANTPPEFKDAVREGVLYWNQAFGKDVVKVIDAPQGVVAPDLEYNVVQWVNWDGAGFAYADAQMDPRSGEILHAQVYMTSAFAYLGKWRARELFKKLKPSTHSHAKRVSLAGFMQDGMCDFSLREALEKSFDTILLNEKDEAKLLQAAQDYVREVMAHEIGHTLGLRHNFAGSLAANYALSEREQLMKSYFEKGQAPAGIITSSSVMEYQLFDEGVITGDQIKRKEKAYGYDEKAIRNLYYGEAVNPNEIPLFCTDSHAGQYVDCMRFDIGASSVEYTKWAVENYARNLPYSLISTYIIAKAPPYGADPVPVQQVSLNPVLLAKGMLGSRYALLGAMTEQGRLLKIHRTFGAVGTFNSDKVKASEMQYMANEAKRLGGLGAVLSAVDNAFAEREYKRFEELLDSGAYTTGVGPDGKKYTFTNDELALIKRDVRLAYEKLQLELVKEDINIMSLPTPPAPPGMTARPLILVEHELTEEIAALNALRVRNYALASTGEFLTGEMSYVEEVPASQPGAQAQKLTKVTTVKLPKFLYPAAIRVLAPAMLKDGKSQSLTWGLAERAKIKKDYTDLLTGALGGVTIEKVKPEELPVPMARWVLENRKVLTAVTGM